MIPPVQTQTISAREVGQALAALATGPAVGRAPDLGGPEVHQLPDLCRRTLRAQGRKKPVIRFPLSRQGREGHGDRCPLARGWWAERYRDLRRVAPCRDLSPPGLINSSLQPRTSPGSHSFTAALTPLRRRRIFTGNDPFTTGSREAYCIELINQTSLFLVDATDLCGGPCMYSSTTLAGREQPPPSPSRRAVLLAAATAGGAAALGGLVGSFTSDALAVTAPPRGTNDLGSIGDSISHNGVGRGFTGETGNGMAVFGGQSFIGWALLQSPARFRFHGTWATGGYDTRHIRYAHLPAAAPIERCGGRPDRWDERHSPAHPVRDYPAEHRLHGWCTAGQWAASDPRDRPAVRRRQHHPEAADPRAQRLAVAVRRVQVGPDRRLLLGAGQPRHRHVPHWLRRRWNSPEQRRCARNGPGPRLNTQDAARRHRSDLAAQLHTERTTGRRHDDRTTQR